MQQDRFSYKSFIHAIINPPTAMIVAISHACRLFKALRISTLNSLIALVFCSIFKLSYPTSFFYHHGGDMVINTIRTVDSKVPLKKVTASRGKMVRTEPISSYYEQGKVHYMGKFPAMEDQMCSYTPESSDSPDPEWMRWFGH